MIGIQFAPGMCSRTLILLKKRIRYMVSEARRKKEELPAMITVGNEKSKTILLADDESTIRKTVKIFLERKGFTVISAVDGVDALNKFYEHRENIDMLLFDVRMPGKNGKEAYTTIKKIKPDIKALLMSGYAKEIVVKDDIQKEEFHFLQKPVSPDRLFDKIIEILET